MKTTKQLVDFNAAPVLTNRIIINLNDSVERLTPQEFATMIASNVAAMAFVMHSSNDTENIKRLFSIMVDDAGKQFEARKKEMAKRAIIQ